MYLDFKQLIGLESQQTVKAFSELWAFFLKSSGNLTNFDVHPKISVYIQQKFLNPRFNEFLLANTKQIPLLSRATLQKRCQNEINPQLLA